MATAQWQFASGLWPQQEGWDIILCSRAMIEANLLLAANHHDAK